ncbi:hypothetical protein D0862_06484 [Hortaea werneckii]|uniref:Septin-type G domain-containing protein n=1 Tax=Hortaea werneckii TaxID=91943 RepID=A0A3M7GK45_HORWE|nr:hypothetical protein D0862_06484 [Hortaea werneckii]
MSASQHHDARSTQSKKSPVAQPPFNPGHSGPTTFFLRSEKDLERSAQRGRRVSRSGASMSGDPFQSSATESMDGSNFGVESLADTINSAFGSESSLSRTNSNSSHAGSKGNPHDSPATSRKRRAGNPVHPKIHAAGQRIISSEHPSTQASSAASPVSLRSSESPFGRRLRRGSAASSINLNSQPLTPLKMSPQPDSGIPGTPRSGSPKSFRLSDEEGSIADDTGSQAIQSSCGDEDDGSVTDPNRSGGMPQLVMPSIAMPARRPFTERGKEMGRLKVMVVGHNGVGKTTLIQSIIRSCEDIVHADQPINITPDDRSPIHETAASTKPCPRWWKDMEGSRISNRRRSAGEGLLQRNICFLDTPGLSDDVEAQQVLRYFDQTIMRTLHLEKLTDSELTGLLSGEGGSTLIHAVLWIFDPVAIRDAEAPHLLSSELQRYLFESMNRHTNVIPLIAHADTLSAEEAAAAKEKVAAYIRSMDVEPFFLSEAETLSESEETAGREVREPLLVSSARTDDTEEVDASILMDPQYVQPLVPSELGYLVEQLLEPNNIARMKHLAATKFLSWRHEHLNGSQQVQRYAVPHSPEFGHTLSSVPSSNSMLEDPSKVLVPYSNSSFYRSTSPSPSDNSLPFAGQDVQTSAYALAKHDDQTQGQQPFREIRLAKWAQDLQRSLNNERKRYTNMWNNAPAEWSSNISSPGSDNEKALTTTAYGSQRPARGRLGGDIAIIDPRDPLGILSLGQTLRRNSLFVLGVAGGTGLVGAVAWWIVRHWGEVQEWFGFGHPVVVTGTAVPAPERGLWDWVVDATRDARNF